jgi:SAM-dependent methyltransferase
MAEQHGFQVPQVAVERYEQYVAPIMAPFVAGIVEHAGIAPGHAVLDVACGTGFATRGAALVAGPTGRVDGVDINPAMLAAARTNARRLGLDISWHEAPADRLPFGDGEFDAVICQQGLQFFPDMTAALREMARVTRRGGRVAATVWAPLHRSPYMTAQYEALREVAGEDAVASFLAAFRFDTEGLATAFGSAALRGVQVHELVAELVLADLESFAAGHLEALPWAGVATAAHRDGVHRVAAGMAEQLAIYRRSDGSVPVTFAALLAVAGS